MGRRRTKRHNLSNESCGKNEPEKEKYTSPQHIVAKKKAVITRMYVEKGEPLAAVDEHVKKGQMLVSGLIGSEDQQKR